MPNRLTVAENSEIKIVRKKNPRGQIPRTEYLIHNKRTGFYTSWSTEELFALDDLIEQLCDEIEEKKNATAARE